VTLNAVSKPVLAACSGRRSQTLKPLLSCGVDLMEISRLEKEVARRGDDLIEELCSAAEQAWCRRRRRPAEGHAMAYAAKEALFKALGTGKAGRMAWRDVEVAWPEGAARPTVTLSGETAAVAERMGVAGVHLALATTREHAVAWVLVTGFGTRDSSGTPQRILTVPRRNCPNPDSRPSTLLGAALNLPKDRTPNPDERKGEH